MQSIDDILNGISSETEAEAYEAYLDSVSEVEAQEDLELQKLQDLEKQGLIEASKNPNEDTSHFESLSKEDYIDLSSGEISAEDIMKLREDPMAPEKFPHDWDTPRLIKNLYDNYLGRIPFSRNLPTPIYREIFVLEVLRKLQNLKSKDFKISNEAYSRNRETIISHLLESYSFEAGSELDVSSIIRKLNSFGIPTHDTSKFCDISDGKVTIDSNYEISPYNALYDLKDLPKDISAKDLKEAQELNARYLKYIDLKSKGYISNEGLFIDDMRLPTEADSAGEIRNNFWGVEYDIEVWAQRLRVIKGQAQTEADYNAKNPVDIKDLYPKPNTKDYKEEPHPVDPNYVLIDGKVAHAGVDPKSPNYPQWKDSMEHTIDEVWKLEADYSNEFIQLEEDMKELKRQFKDRREWYNAQGVSVKVVDRAIRRIKRNAKRTPADKRIEDEIFERLSQNSNLVSRINALAV